MSQSTHAHRLVLKARKIGGQKLQTPLITSIFKATMQEGRDISDVDVLSDLAAEGGIMSKADVSTFAIASLAIRVLMAKL
jgi:predicted DsbA family dithiol-disulfide isomerase